MTCIGTVEPRLFTPLVHMPYGSRIYYRHVLDLLNEITNIDFGQGATKLSEVKVGGQKRKNLLTQPDLTQTLPRLAELAEYF